ncbi:MBL fold metallo-hydrolase [Ulvibacter antarcticus]|uniref:Glyoxylase-like metal-dependent hydrolase (Beta-lactamase superfamily II) n=1 Tax=Ulvibacter antarcticus TaxID=442714 RepID=A0A3L9ZG39_9FLAO|nr:MBL fold metallo-hydrolase [Ulvibacter antarcticus]RMA65682.1 glyoxylase-like metal-dependent hydrolase (beta-lactamase superfamily II) [Ulvibacter antarcticus]
MRHRIFVILSLFLSTFFVSAQDTDAQAVENGVMPTTITNDVGVVIVKDSIFMLKGRGGNIGVSIGEDGVFMIDDQFADASKNIINRIGNLTNKPIELVVNTHHHKDHVSGNSNMASKGALIFSHENARERMEASYRKFSTEDRQKKIDSIVSASGAKLISEEDVKMAHRAATKVVDDQMIGEIPRGALPVVSFPNTLTFNYNGEEIKLFHIPNAHTDGDVVVYFTKSNVLHTGDAFVNGMYPFIDTKNDGSIQGYILGLNRISQIINDQTKIIPGHGNMATAADVAYTKRMLEFIRDKVAYQVVAKKTEGEVMAMREITKEYDDRGYGDGFIPAEKLLSAIYQGMAKKYSKK